MRELDFVFAEVLNYNESQDLEMLERTPVHEVVDLEDSEDEQETKEAENHDERLVCVCVSLYVSHKDVFDLWVLLFNLSVRVH